MMVLAPEKLRLSSGIRPPKISQIASKSMPRFLVSLIAIRRTSLGVGLKECRPEQSAEMQLTSTLTGARDTVVEL